MIQLKVASAQEVPAASSMYRAHGALRSAPVVLDTRFEWAVLFDIQIQGTYRQFLEYKG